MATSTKAITFRQAVKELKDRRIASVLFLGFISGFPWILHGSMLTLWLQESGLSRGAIGLFGIVTSVYVFKFLWAPILDRVRIPFLSNILDQRRAWIVLTLLVIAVCCFGMSIGNPVSNLKTLALFALIIATSSATQDIVIDAYRIDVFEESEVEKVPYAAAAATGGWWAGYGFIGGALALYLAGESIGLAWPKVYQVMALICCLQIVGLFLLPRVVKSSAIQHQEATSIGNWLFETVLRPFIEFFQRCGWKLAISLLVFVFTFKMGEAFVGRMSLVFYKEIGFSTEQIGFYNKFLGGLLTMVFAFMGAMFNTRFGLVKGLFLAGVTMAATNLFFSALAVVGPNAKLLTVAIILDNLTAAFATVAFIAFISHFTTRAFTATQYALLAALGTFGRTTVSSASGFVVDAMNGNWFWFFILTALMVIPPLLLLLWMSSLLREYDARQNSA